MTGAPPRDGSASLPWRGSSSEAVLSSSEPPEAPASVEAGGTGASEEPPPPPPPPVQGLWADEPPPPPPPTGAGARDADGPGISEPRRRRGLVLGVAAAVVVVAVPVVLAVVAAVSAPDADAPAETATGGEEAGEGSESEPEPVQPDLESLSGRDAILARLLSEVDESEQAMIAFQDRLEEVVRDPDGEPEDRLTEVRAAAEEGATALDEVRSELVRPVEDQGFDEVRIAYLSHHDAWADYLDALAEDPRILLQEAESSRWLVSINLSAEVFARELREAVDDDLATSVREYARDILARGFEQPDRTPDA